MERIHRNKDSEDGSKRQLKLTSPTRGHYQWPLPEAILCQLLPHKILDKQKKLTIIYFANEIFAGEYFCNER
jgi:hypothetical protein